jgi:hypothetical protein
MFSVAVNISVGGCIRFCGFLLFGFFLDQFVDLFPVYGDFGRSFDSESNFVTSDIDNGYDDVIANNDALIALSRKYKHERTPVSLTADGSSASMPGPYPCLTDGF